MTPVRASSSVVKVRLYSTLPMTMAMTTTASSSHIAVVDMIYFPSKFPFPRSQSPKTYMEINFCSLTQSESLHPLGTDFPVKPTILLDIWVSSGYAPIIRRTDTMKIPRIKFFYGISLGQCPNRRDDLWSI